MNTKGEMSKSQTAKWPKPMAFIWPFGNLRFGNFLLSLLLLPVLPSCAPPMMLAGPTIQAISAGAGAYVNGEIQAAWTIPINSLWPAAQAAVRDLQFTVVRERLDDSRKGVIFVQDAVKRSIEINMTAVTPTVTRFTIRVGVFGDEAISRLIVKSLELEVQKLHEASSQVPSHATEREP